MEGSAGTAARTGSLHRKVVKLEKRGIQMWWNSSWREELEMLKEKVAKQKNNEAQGVKLHCDKEKARVKWLNQFLIDQLTIPSYHFIHANSSLNDQIIHLDTWYCFYSGLNKIWWSKCAHRKTGFNRLWILLLHFIRRSQAVGMHCL